MNPPIKEETDDQETPPPVHYLRPTLPTDPGQYVVCALGAAGVGKERLDREGRKEREGAKGERTEPGGLA